VASSIENSDEYRTIQVESLYGQFLHRTADPSGLAFGMSYLQNGGTVDGLAAILAGSPEYFQTRGGNTNDGFLDALFLDALNRTVDPGARTFYDQQLSSGTSREQVALEVFNTD